MHVPRPTEPGTLSEVEGVHLAPRVCMHAADSEREHAQAPDSILHTQSL